MYRPVNTDACRFIAYDSDRVTFRNCTAFGNLAKQQDGGGFALDGGVTNSVIEYCTSYDNWGSGYKAAARSDTRASTNNTIRYSSSRGDGNGLQYASVTVWGDAGSTMTGLKFYGNSINVTDTVFCDHWGYTQIAHHALYLWGSQPTVSW